MDKYICSCCGGKINRMTMTCEYCGTQYEEKHNNLIRIETFRNPVETLGCDIPIPTELFMELGAKKASEVVMRNIVNELSQCIAPYIEVAVEDDHLTNHKIVHSRVKVVRPIHTEWRL